jgi:ABC-type xylose transport system permease subunit
MTHKQQYLLTFFLSAVGAGVIDVIINYPVFGWRSFVHNATVLTVGTILGRMRGRMEAGK